MSTKTLILAGNRIWETCALVSVSRSPCSVATRQSAALTPTLPSPLHLVTSGDRCSYPSAMLRENTLYGSHLMPGLYMPLDAQPRTPESHSGLRSLRQALLSTDWLKCTWHLILKVYKRFNIQKLFFARVKLNNSYYVYKIPSMKNKGLSELIKKEVLQKL